MNPIRIVVCALAVLAVTLVHGQILQRKGALGAQLENAPNVTGISLVKVFPYGTAHALGLRNGDVITAINNVRVPDVAVLVGMVKT